MVKEVVLIQMKDLKVGDIVMARRIENDTHDRLDTRTMGPVQLRDTALQGDSRWLQLIFSDPRVDHRTLDTAAELATRIRDVHRRVFVMEEAAMSGRLSPHRERQIAQAVGRIRRSSWGDSKIIAGVCNNIMENLQGLERS